jgi:protoporphyrinogen IX oxidase
MGLESGLEAVWAKFLHISFMAVWIAALFYLPRLLLGHAAQRAQLGHDSAEESRMTAIEEFVFFYIATPAGVLTILFGVWLTAYGVSGGWLPVKLVFVALLVLLHFYCGRIILAFRHGEVPHGPTFYHALTQVPWILLVVVVYIAVAKPL